MNLPIGLTLTRIVAVPFLILFLISSSRVHAFIGAGIFILASFTDWLDGTVARRRNQVTTLGTLLDPIADKLLLVTVFTCLSVAGLSPWWLTAIVLLRDLVIVFGAMVYRWLFGPLDGRPTTSRYSQVALLQKSMPPTRPRMAAAGIR